MERPTINRVREVFDYNAEAGILSRKGESTSAAMPCANGHLYVRIDGQKLTAQQVAWAHANGCWPAGRVGLVNKDKSDLRLCNLRDVTKCSSDAELTLDRLRDVLAYDESTGVFTWKKVSAGTRIESGFAGAKAIGGRYTSITVDQRHYLSHRLAWFYFYGKWPDGEIDHIDGCGTNNRIENLRDVSHSVNMQNVRKKTARNKSGSLMGVSVSLAGGITSAITVNGKSYHLGTFETEMAAHDAYLAAKRSMHEGCTI